MSYTYEFRIEITVDLDTANKIAALLPVGTRLGPNLFVSPDHLAVPEPGD